METSDNKEDKSNILKFLEDFNELKMQYLFLNCFVISSDKIYRQHKEAQKKIKNLNDIETYYTPEYLYKKKKDDPMFELINKQSKKRFYYLKEHIFYYQYLLRCLKVKNGKENKEIINTSYVNEISYRTLLNRLYLLCDRSNTDDNYGICKLFDVPCIYSTIETDVIEQILNMKKFSFELLKMSKDKVIELFGINPDIDNQTYLYNKLLISISEGNSSISGTNSISYDKNDDPNKINKGAIEIEKFLINFSSELFLFYYITRQFVEEQEQLPRMIFFCGIYDEQCRNIYQIQSEKEKKKKGERVENSGAKEKIDLIVRTSIEGKESKQGKGEEKKVDKRKEKREGRGKKIETGVKKEKGKIVQGISGAEHNNIIGGDSAQKKEIGITGKEIVFKKVEVSEKLKGAKLIEEEGIIHKKEKEAGKDSKEVIEIETNIKKIKVNRIKKLKERKEEKKLIGEERVDEGELEKDKKEELKQKEYDTLKGDKKEYLKGYELEILQKEREKKGVLKQKEGKKGKNEKEKAIETEKIDKNLLKCNLINFCGTLELDGAFKYKGNPIEIKGDSLVVILSECLNRDNNIIIYTQKYEAKHFLQKMGKNQNNINSFKPQKYNTIKINMDKIDDSLKILEEMANKEIICDKKISINKNDLILIENKREYPHHMPNEIRNFIEHSLFFISLYKNLKLIEKEATIHLLFVYDHSRNYNDEREVVVELYKIINDNSKKLKLFPNEIKFSLVHSLPNLHYSLFNKLQTEINDLKNKIKVLEATNNRLNNEIKEQHAINNNLNNEIKEQHAINDNLNNEIKEQHAINDKLNNKIDDLEKKIEEMKSHNKQ